MPEVDIIKTSFATGELSPQFWGRTDLPVFHNGASVMRNCFVDFRGGISSRPGMAFVGPCKQAGTAANPPRIIGFHFSHTQNYVLEFGDNYMRVIFQGAYVEDVTYGLTGVATGSTTTLQIPGNTFSAGDLIFITGAMGSSQVNNNFYLVQTGGSASIVINDTFGNEVDSTTWGAYSGGGTVGRVYTIFSPYSAVDLPYLKFTQSADTMSLCLVNQTTNTEYQPYDLKRLGAANWVFNALNFAASIGPPLACLASATVTGSPATQYSYVVTAVSQATGEESIASPAAFVTNSVDIASTAGSIQISWSAVPGAAYYNVYKAPPAYDAPVPIGSSYGYIATAFGTAFVDSNIVSDFTKTPPLHQNPFARGTVLYATPITLGSGYTQATASVTITTATGSGAVITPVVVSGGVTSYIVQNGGSGYAATDTLVVHDSGAGTGATATMKLGPQTGTYPSVPAYFQERRVYANTLTNPDTYYMSQTGAFANFDSSVPPQDSDAIIGAPWAQQVNGIQWAVPMPGGLLVGTGLDAWQLQGTAGQGSTFSPAQQSAQAQETNGFSATIEPTKINYELMYVQSLGTVVRVLQYNYFINIYAGTDISFQSNHLFESYQVVQWDFAKEPFKIMWTVRNDGKFLALSYLREQDIKGWSRHDTNGQVVSLCTVSEPPVDAVYLVVKRFIKGKGAYAYYVERMDNRNWQTAEDPFCVDCGSSFPLTTPNASLSASSYRGSGTITSSYVVSGGANYTDPSIIITDPTGAGSGCVVVPILSSGQIASIFISNPGSNYNAIEVEVRDATGSGAVIQLNISQSVTFTASSGVFSSSSVGAIIRMGGGIAQINAVLSPTQVTAQMKQPITAITPDDPFNTPTQAPAGTWSATQPITKVTNLGHLEGMEVTGLADASVIPLQTVTNAEITLPKQSTAIHVGLPFIVQLQGMHALVGAGQADAPTIQHKRKTIARASIRVKASRGLAVGANQPIASKLSGQPEIPWDNMEFISDRSNALDNGLEQPLFTGDYYLPIRDSWSYQGTSEANPGMVAVQQTYPLPMNVEAYVMELTVGDGK